jgi:hypothetical protein
MTPVLHQGPAPCSPRTLQSTPVTTQFAPFTDALMLRLDIGDPPSRTYYVTPFVTDGPHLYVFDEPGERSEALEAMLLDLPVRISSRSTGDLEVSAVCRRPTPAEQAWARDACSARFFYDQALQDLAQLGSIVVAVPTT